MNMENMDRLLSQGQPETPEEPEYEPGSPEAKVDAWAKEYSETHQPKELAPYELSPEVGEWFAEYDNRWEAARLQANSREELRKLRTELETEYDEKLQQDEYKLFALRNREGRDDMQARILGNRMLDQADRKWWEDHKGEIPPRNILTHFEKTATAIADVEGLGWAGNQLRADFSLSGALKYLAKHKEDPNLPMYEIYGDGGYNRWFVNAKGEVIFGKEFVAGISKEKIAEKIARRGFEVR